MLENRKDISFLIAAIIFVGLAIFGGARAFSPVPFWDMWDGYLGFFVNVSNGDWSAWWAQHNEHRIILARVFFWLDLALFSGQGLFLICVNYALQMLVCLLFLHAWKEIDKQNQHAWIGYFLICWLFYWIQKDNFEWGFQSQFIMAQLLPLAGFYFLHLDKRQGARKATYFSLSLLMGILAIGSMANGVMALPILLVFALLTRMSLSRVLILAVATVFILGLYFYGYKAPAGHGSIRQAILSNPFGLLQYAAVYMGGPFSFGSKGFGLWMATLAGAFLIFSSIYFAWKALKEPSQASLQLALLCFILYVSGTAFGTGGGRLIFGIEQALSSRYMTPSLMAWAAFFMLSYINVKRFQDFAIGKLWVLLSTFLLLMLPSQLEAIKSKTDVLFERDIAALALELGVNDQIQIAHVFPSADWALEIAKTPVLKNLSVFGKPPLQDIREQVGANFSRPDQILQECKGHLDVIEQVRTDPRFLRIRGWLFNASKKTKGQLVNFVNSENMIAGFAITGQERPDVAAAIDRDAFNSGFKGYVQSEAQGETLNVFSSAMNCRMLIKIPIMLFKLVDSSNLSIQPNV